MAKKDEKYRGGGANQKFSNKGVVPGANKKYENLPTGFANPVTVIKDLMKKKPKKGK